MGISLGVLASGGVMFAQRATKSQMASRTSLRRFDTAWLLIVAFLVFFMQAGFGLVEAGFVRVKNTSNILMKTAMDASLGIIVYWAIGFGSLSWAARRAWVSPSTSTMRRHWGQQKSAT